MEHIDFHISYRCVNDCIFCSSSGAIQDFGRHPLRLAQIKSLLKNKSGSFKSVNFTGGEPTLLSFLPHLVRDAKKLGYQVYVGTNGAGFSDKKFCRETAPFIDKVCFSFHGHNERLHDFHTAKRGSFRSLKRAVGNLSRYPLYFMSNTVLTRFNLPFARKIVPFLGKMKIKQALFSNLAPEGKGLDNYKLLAARLNAIRKDAACLVRSASRHNMVLRFFGVPACVLGAYAVHSNDFYWDPRLNIEQAAQKGKFYIKEEKACFPDRKRVKTAKCRACFYRNICGGVFEAYYNNFGDEELETVIK